MIDTSLLDRLRTLYPGVVPGTTDPLAHAAYALAVIESDLHPEKIGDNGQSFGAWQINRPSWAPIVSFPPPDSILDQALWISPVLQALIQSPLPINVPRWWRWHRSDAPEQPIDTAREEKYRSVLVELSGAASNLPSPSGSPAGAAAVAGGILFLLFLLWLLSKR